MSLVHYREPSIASSVVYEKLSDADLQYYAAKKATCLLCEKPLIDSRFSAPQSLKEKITNAFNALNPFICGPDKTAFGHKNNDEQENRPPKLIHCYHKICLEKTGVFAKEMQSVMKIDACCNTCTRSISNIGEFLTKASWKERVWNSVGLIHEHENALVYLLSHNDLPKMNAWNITSDIYALVTGVAIGALSGGFMGAINVHSQNYREDMCSDMEAVAKNALTGAFIGAVNSIFIGLGSRITALGVAPTIAVLGSEGAASGAVLAGGQLRSMIGSGTVAIGGGFSATQISIGKALTIGATTSTAIILIGAAFGKAIYSPNDEFPKRILMKKVVNAADIEIAKMRNQFEAEKELFFSRDRSFGSASEDKEDDWSYLKELFDIKDD